ncbi:unnamed protein product [Ixodes pacificus]
MSFQGQAVAKDVLGPDDNCLAWLDAGLVQEWVKTGRLLLLVQHSNAAHGLLVCHRGDDSAPNPILPAEHCFPIDGDFKCEIGGRCSRSSNISPFTQPSGRVMELKGGKTSFPVTFKSLLILSYQGLPKQQLKTAHTSHVSLVEEAASNFLWLVRFGIFLPKECFPPFPAKEEHAFPGRLTPPRSLLSLGAASLAGQTALKQSLIRTRTYPHLQPQTCSSDPQSAESDSFLSASASLLRICGDLLMTLNSVSSFLKNCGYIISVCFCSVSYRSDNFVKRLGNSNLFFYSRALVGIHHRKQCTKIGEDEEETHGTSVQLR